MKISDGAIIRCNYVFCVKVVNKSNIQTNTPSIVTPIRDNVVPCLVPNALDTHK
jgi:hypothetical protein